MPQKQKVSVEEKIRIVREYIGGKIGVSEAARQCNTVTACIVEWAAKYESEGVEAFLPRKNRGYEPDEKLEAIKEYLTGDFTQIEICKKYKIRSTSRLREWIKVNNEGGKLDTVKRSGGGSYMKQGRNTTKEERIQIAKECIATDKNYGAVALKYQVSYQQARTWTLRFEKLGENGLEDRRGKRKKDQVPRTELEQAQIEIEQLKHKLYLSAILDLYDRRIVAYVISERNDNALVFKTFDKAVAVNPDAHPLFHSDRGYQYTNRTFHAKLEQAGMIQSMSRVAHCIDNGPMEGFWGILKRERYYSKRFTSKKYLSNMICQYIAYYNSRRVSTKSWCADTYGKA